MVWQIIDERSNLLGEFDDEPSALSAVREMATDEPSVIDEIALVAFDDEGRQVAEPALTGASLRAALEGPRPNEGSEAA